MGDLAQVSGTAIYAWALLPNHAHLLLRSGPAGLPDFMRRLLTGYAITFNRRHKRVGHLFQNRYKSMVCEEVPYFHELVRYLHLNPLRAGLLTDLPALDRYPWGGHATILGRLPRPWQDRQAVLAGFGKTSAAAIPAYRKCMAEGLPLGRRPEPVGGGLIRSAGGWAEIRAMRQRKEPEAGDPRILGSGRFVEQVVHEAERRRAARWKRPPTHREIADLIRVTCQGEGISQDELQAGSRRDRIPAIRAELTRRLVTRLGLSLAEVARRLGVSTAAISKIMRKGGTE